MDIMKKKEMTFLYSLQADYSWSHGSHKTFEKSALETLSERND
jgi:hypothetical protein